MNQSNGKVTVKVGGVDIQGQKVGWSSGGLSGNLPVLELVKLETGDFVRITQCCGVIPEVKKSEIVDYDAFSGITLELELQCECGSTCGTAHG